MPNLLSKEIGARLKRVRETHGLSQYECAIETGIKRENLAAYETGRNLLPLRHAITICETLGVSLDVLIRGTERIKPDPVYQNIVRQLDKLPPRYSNAVLQFIKTTRNVFADTIDN